jgi:hypothetical protein
MPTWNRDEIENIFNNKKEYEKIFTSQDGRIYDLKEA